MTFGRKFKISEYNPFADLQYEVHNLIPCGDNRKIVKLGYHSLSINNECKIEFNNYKLKMDANIRATWNIFFSFRNKNPNRGGNNDFKIDRRYCEDVETSTWILKCNV